MRLPLPSNYGRSASKCLSHSHAPGPTVFARAKPFRQRYAIFDLSRDHVAIKVATSFISSQAQVLLVGDTAPVDAPVDDE